MSQSRRSPAELRSMFGANLRQLSQTFPSISELSRQLGINRTQFNRYLAGESFPRPDVLARICEFFDVDARVILEPVDQIGAQDEVMSGKVLNEFLGSSVNDVSEATFPSGFYRFSRRSFIDQMSYVVGLVFVWRSGQATYVRGLEARAALLSQGLPLTRDKREFRGLVLQQEDGVAALISHKGGTTASFNFLSRVASFENNYWVGYVARTMREAPETPRVVRMVYEHIGSDFSVAKEVAQSAGYCKVEQLLPFHQRLLQPDRPFL